MMQYKPHEYQKYATNFILNHPVSAILLDMGLGKTSIALTAIEHLLQAELLGRFITLPFELSGVVVIVTGQPSETDYQADHYGTDDCD